MAISSKNRQTLQPDALTEATDQTVSLEPDRPLFCYFGNLSPRWVYKFLIEIVCLVAVKLLGDNPCRVVYRRPDGRLGEQPLFRSDEDRLALAEAGPAWAFDAPGAEFKLGLEVCRIHLAHLFDPMLAVHTANVEPLPHQISAVYEAMLPRQPLCFTRPIAGTSRWNWLSGFKD